jgi:hypothetical protein
MASSRRQVAGDDSRSGPTVRRHVAGRAAQPASESFKRFSLIWAMKQVCPTADLITLRMQRVPRGPRICQRTNRFFGPGRFAMITHHLAIAASKPLDRRGVGQRSRATTQDDPVIAPAPKIRPPPAASPSEVNSANYSGFEQHPPGGLRCGYGGTAITLCRRRDL